MRKSAEVLAFSSNRRQFMIGTAVVTAGLATPVGVLRSALAAGGWWQLLASIGGFALDVGYEKLRDLYSQWMGKLSPQEQTSVQGFNHRLSNKGYEDPSQYSFPLFGNASQHCAVIPVARDDYVNGLGVFYDFCKCTCNAALSAPSTVGLQAASAELRGSGISASQMKSFLLPQSQHSTAYGRFERSYSDPDTYSTQEGLVNLDYERTGRSTGEVRVVASRDNLTGSRVAFDRTYELNIA